MYAIVRETNHVCRVEDGTAAVSSPSALSLLSLSATGAAGATGEATGVGAGTLPDKCAQQRVDKKKARREEQRQQQLW